MRNNALLLASVASVAAALPLYTGGIPDGAYANPSGSADATLPAISNVRVRSSLADEVLDVTLPYSKPSADQETLDFTFDLEFAKGQSAMFHITPAGCLYAMDINGRAAIFTADSLTQRCNPAKAAELDLKPFLHPGINDMHLVLIDIGIPHSTIGLAFQPAAAGHLE